MEKKELHHEIEVLPNKESSGLAADKNYQKTRGARKKKRKGRTKRQILAGILLCSILLAIAGIRWCQNQGFVQKETVNQQDEERTKKAKSVIAEKSEQEESNLKEEHIKYKELPVQDYSIREGSLILVNPDFGINKGTQPVLANVYKEKAEAYYVKDTNVNVKESIMQALNQMLTDFYGETGISNVMVNSGYRTESYQQKLYQRDLDENHTDSSEFVAKPGYSEHQTGMAVDLGVYKPSHSNQEYEGTGEYQWINNMCQRYGFIVRYPEDKISVTGIGYEPWHFRYVGIPHAEIIRKGGLCLEEYIEFIKAYSVDKPYVFQAEDGVKYNVYYVSGKEEQIKIPENAAYEISGNNIDGFIVTVY